MFDFVGMMGVPLTPCHEFPTNAPAAFFSVHALKDADFVPKLEKFVLARKPVLLTDGLARALAHRMKLDLANIQILPVKDDPKSLLQFDQKECDEVRAPLLRPFKTSFQAPARVALYLFKDKSWVVENFNDEAVHVQVNGKSMEIAGRFWVQHWR